MKKKLRSQTDGKINFDDKGIEAVARRYAVGVTDHVMSSIQNSNDAIAKQYIPDIRELKILPGESTDPIGDDVHSPVKGIVHRYPDRALLKLAHVCAVYCRYCFRREMVGKPDSEILKPQERNAALDYIRNNKNIWEVILTGGDPFVLSPRQINDTLNELCAIEHVKVIRIHTRVPVADPKRVTNELCNILKREKAVYVALHVNHAQELTKEVRIAIKKLFDANCVLLSQSVLLKGVNDDADILEDLFRELTALRVKPYYLHHPDLAPGTSHFRLSIKRGRQIMKQLLGRVSGLCQPHYMLDIPGGHGKLPIGPSYIEGSGDHYILEDYNGVKHPYEESHDDN
jgi:lysine 2,3-aminomutase